MAKLTKVQKRVLRLAIDQDACEWLDMATEIQRAMFWKMEQRGYLYIRRDVEMAWGYGVLDSFDTITPTDKGHKALQAQG
jgi:hypothetical protein